MHTKGTWESWQWQGGEGKRKAAMGKNVQRYTDGLLQTDSLYLCSTLLWVQMLPHFQWYCMFF